MGWKTLTAYGRLTSNIRQNCFLSSSVYYSHLGNFDYMNLHTPAMQIKQQVSSELQEFGWRNSLENKLSNNLSLFGGFDFQLNFTIRNICSRIRTVFRITWKADRKICLPLHFLFILR